SPTVIAARSSKPLVVLSRFWHGAQPRTRLTRGGARRGDHGTPAGRWGAGSRRLVARVGAGRALDGGGPCGSGRRTLSTRPPGAGDRRSRGGRSTLAELCRKTSRRMSSPEALGRAGALL